MSEPPKGGIDGVYRLTVDIGSKVDTVPPITVANREMPEERHRIRERALTREDGWGNGHRREIRWRRRGTRL
jgi:hypothetical protein